MTVFKSKIITFLVVSGFWAYLSSDIASTKETLDQTDYRLALSELEETLEELDTTKKLLEKEKNQSNQLKEETQSLKTRISENKLDASDREKLKDKLEVLLSEHEISKSKAKELFEKQNKLLTRKNKEASILENENLEILKTLDQEQANSKNLKSKVQEMQTELAMANQALEHNDKLSKSLEDILEEQKKSEAKVSELVKKQNKIMTNLQQENNSLKKENEQAKADLSNQKEQILAELNKEQMYLDQISAKVEQMQEEMDKAKQAHDYRDRLSVALKTLSDKQNSAVKKISDLSKRHKEIANELALEKAASAQERQTFESEKSDIIAELENERNITKNLESQIKGLRTKLEQTKKETTDKQKLQKALASIISKQKESEEKVKELIEKQKQLITRKDEELAELIEASREFAEQSGDDKAKILNELELEINKTLYLRGLLEKEVNLKRKIEIEKHQVEQDKSLALQQTKQARELLEKKSSQFGQIQNENALHIQRLEKDKLALEDKINQLSRKLDQTGLRKKNRALEAEVENLKKQRDKAEQVGETAEKLSEQIRVKEKEIFKQTQKSLDLENQAVNKELKIRQAELAKIEKELKEARQQNLALTKKTMESEQKVRQLRADQNKTTLRFLEDRVDSEIEKGQKLKAAKENVVKTLEKTEKKSKHYQKALPEFIAKVSKLELENSDLSNQLQKLSKTMDNRKKTTKSVIQTLLDKIKQEHSSYQKRLEKLKQLMEEKLLNKDSKVSELKDKFKAAVEEMSKQKKKYTSMYRHLKTAQAEIEAIKERQEIENLPKTMADKKVKEEENQIIAILTQNIAAHENQIRAMKEREQSLFEELSVAKEEVNILKNSIDEVYAANEKLIKSKNALESETAEKEKTIFQMQDKLSYLVQKEAQLTQKIIDMERELDYSRPKVAKEVHEKFNAQIAQAKNQQALLKEKIDELTDGLTRSNQLAESLSDGIALEKQTNEKLRQDLEDSKYSRERLKNIEENFNRQMQEANQKQAELEEKLKTISENMAKSKELSDMLTDKVTLEQNKTQKLNEELEKKEQNLQKIKKTSREVLSQVGISGKLSEPESKNDYLKMVSDLQLSKLGETVLSSGRGQLNPELKDLLENQDLAQSMVDKLKALKERLEKTKVESSFTKIFAKTAKNQIRSEFSKLYTFFLSRASIGINEDSAFNDYKQLAAEFFNNSNISAVKARQLSDPENPLILSLSEN